MFSGNYFEFFQAKSYETISLKAQITSRRKGFMFETVSNSFKNYRSFVFMRIPIFEIAFLIVKISADSQEREESNVESSVNNVEEQDKTDNADPFIPSQLLEENDNGSNENNSTNLAENDQKESNLATVEEEEVPEGALESNVSPGSKESLEMIEDKKQDSEPDVAISNDLFGMGNSDKESKKEGSRFWTEVVIDDKPKNVLVNVKTVTIIESINTIAPSTSSSKITSTRSASSSSNLTNSSSASQNTSSVSASRNMIGSSDTFPYIKIQMPSANFSTQQSISTINSKSVHSTSKLHSRSAQGMSTKTASRSTSSKFNTISRKHNTASTKNSSVESPISISTKSTRSASTTKSTTISSVNTSTATVIKSITSRRPKSSTVSNSTVASSIIKKDGFSKPISTNKVEQPKTVSASNKNEDLSSVGSIFNVLKNLPSGGKDNASLYVEGTFKFPKKKELSDKVFKLSGYVSQN
jgi:hypothetical protein